MWAIVQQRQTYPKIHLLSDIAARAKYQIHVVICMQQYCFLLLDVDLRLSLFNTCDGVLVCILAGYVIYEKVRSCFFILYCSPLSSVGMRQKQ